MRTEKDPHTGRTPRHHGVARWTVCSPGHICSEESPAGDPFDRCMNWLVGALLVAATTAVIALQVHPPL
jgi:hypothetical protein